VIIESAAIKTEAFSRVFSDYPNHLEEIVQHHLDNVSLSRFEKFKFVFQNILKERITREDMVKLGQLYADYSLDDTKNCPEVEGAKEFLEIYSSRLPLFVVSGTPEEELREIVTYRGLNKYFTEVYGSPRWKREICVQILQTWSFESSECVFIGDSMTDFQEAQHVGIPFVGRAQDGEDTFDGLGIPVVQNLLAFKKFLDEKFPYTT